MKLKKMQQKELTTCGWHSGTKFNGLESIESREEKEHHIGVLFYALFYVANMPDIKFLLR